MTDQKLIHALRQQLAKQTNKVAIYASLVYRIKRILSEMTNIMENAGDASYDTIDDNIKSILALIKETGQQLSLRSLQ